MSLADREHLITDAGRLIPGFSIEEHGVEFFVHSPFASRLEDGTLVDRNIDALAFQATFSSGVGVTRLFLSSDLRHEAFADIVRITQYHGNEDRLKWDIFNTPHHCSYLSLSPVKGKEKTNPIPEVEWLFETQGEERAIIVSTSKPIPDNDNDDQPPHRQAANYYKEVAAQLGGEFIVSMEHPNTTSPEPLAITVDSFGATVRKVIASSSVKIISHSAPRAG